MLIITGLIIVICGKWQDAASHPRSRYIAAGD